jgi:sirohydrochlorin ferrochelatase
VGQGNWTRADGRFREAIASKSGAGDWRHGHKTSNHYHYINVARSVHLLGRATWASRDDPVAVRSSRLISTGVLIVGHGTRNLVGQEEFRRVGADLVARLAPRPAVACCLELVEPDIASGLDSLLGQGARRIIVVPVLLGEAGHHKSDIPAAVRAALQRQPAPSGGAVEWRQTAALGSDDRILELSQRRFAHALAAAPSVAPADATLLLVGRGTSDPQAAEEVRQFAVKRRNLERLPAAETCFVAAASPRLSVGISQLAAKKPRCVVVQPHLLFTGQVLEEIAEEVAAARARYPETEWRLATHLGPDPLVVDALEQRVLALLD